MMIERTVLISLKGTKCLTAKVVLSGFSKTATTTFHGFFLCLRDIRPPLSTAPMGGSFRGDHNQRATGGPFWRRLI
jgi:hypothetical protein